MGDVVGFPGLTTHPLDPDHVLEANKGAGFERLLLLATGPDGKLIVAGTHGDTAMNLLLLKKAEWFFMEHVKSAVNV